MKKSDCLNLITPVVGVGSTEGSAALWYAATCGLPSPSLSDLLKEVYLWNALTFARIKPWVESWDETLELGDLEALTPVRDINFNCQHAWFATSASQRVLLTFQFVVGDSGVPQLVVLYTIRAGDDIHVIESVCRRENIDISLLPVRREGDQPIYSFTVNWVADDVMLYNIMEDMARPQLPAYACLLLGSSNGAISPLLRLFEINSDTDEGTLEIYMKSFLEMVSSDFSPSVDVPQFLKLYPIGEDAYEA